MAKAHGQPPEVAQIRCVGATETAAEKLVALTRRIAMELAGLSRDPNPTLVRHIYDLYLMQGHIDPVQVGTLAGSVAAFRFERSRLQAWHGDSTTGWLGAAGSMLQRPAVRR